MMEIIISQIDINREPVMTPWDAVRWDTKRYEDGMYITEVNVTFVIRSPHITIEGGKATYKINDPKEKLTQEDITKKLKKQIQKAVLSDLGIDFKKKDL